MPRSILHARVLRDTSTEPDGKTPTGGGGDGNGKEPAGGGDTSKTDENGFPADTPISDMTPDQKIAYWKHQARKHEQRAEGRKDYDAIKSQLDSLKAEHQTEAEKAIEQARKESADTARAEARAEYASKIVAAKLEAALATKMPAEKIGAHVEYLDHTKFLTDDGEVDTDKVKQYAAGFSPTWPDTGQGKRGDGGGSARGVAAGADLFAASRGKKTA